MIYVCGLTGTITAAVRLLIDRGFSPHAPLTRASPDIPSEARGSLFFELYDPQSLRE